MLLLQNENFCGLVFQEAIWEMMAARIIQLEVSNFPRVKKEWYFTHYHFYWKHQRDWLTDRQMRTQPMIGSQRYLKIAESGSSWGKTHKLNTIYPSFLHYRYVYWCDLP